MKTPARTVGTALGLALVAAGAVQGPNWAWLALLPAAAIWVGHAMRGWDTGWCIPGLAAAAAGAPTPWLPVVLAGLGLAFLARRWRDHPSWHGAPAVVAAAAIAWAAPRLLEPWTSAGRLPSSIEGQEAAVLAWAAILLAAAATAVSLVRFRVTPSKEWVKAQAGGQTQERA